MTVSIYCNTGFFIEQCSVKQRYGGKVKKDATPAPSSAGSAWLGAMD